MAVLPPYDFPSFDDLKPQRGLPDPFIMFDGSRVKTLEDWEKQRMYIKDMLLYYQYGYYPPPPKNLKVEIKSSKAILNGKAMETRLILSMGPNNSITIRVDLSVPVKGSGQGQRTLSVLSSKDLHQEVDAPSGHSSFHHVAFFSGMLLDQA